MKQHRSAAICLRTHSEAAQRTRESNETTPGGILKEKGREKEDGYRERRPEKGIKKEIGKGREQEKERERERERERGKGKGKRKGKRK